MIGAGNLARQLYLASSSSLQRLAHCPSSVALVHVEHVDEYNERGRAIHSYLESIATLGREEALAAVPDEWQPTCGAILLDKLGDQLSLAAEVALAYHVFTDSARELARGQGRAYADVTHEEIPMTLDAVGVAVLENGIRRGLVVDWKSGWSWRDPAVRNWQMRGTALAAARAYDLDVVEVQLIHVEEDRPPWISRAVFNAWDLDLFARELAGIYAAAVDVRRAAVDKRWHDLRFTMGPWCRFCPAQRACPAQVTLIRAIVSGDELDGLMRVSPIADKDLADAWDLVGHAQAVVSRLKGQIIGAASKRAIRLRDTPDGLARFLGPIHKPGNRVLDGDVVFDVVAEEPTLGEEAAAAATKVTATQTDIKEAIRAAHAKAGITKAMGRTLDKVLAAVEERGGVTRKPSVSIEEYVSKDGNPLPEPSSAPGLPAGQPEKSSGE